MLTQPPMMLMARLAIVMGAALLAPRLAMACGAARAPYVTLADGLPTARAGLPRDGAVVVRGKFWAPSGGAFNFAQVRLVDQLGNQIPARDESWYSTEPSMAVRPMVPLPPRTRFFVEATVLDPEMTARPPGADGPQTLRLEYETGDELASPLTLAGPLKVTLEPFVADVLECEGGTGCSPGQCTKVGTRPALRARIVVPAATGGVDFDGYRGWLRFNDNVPATFAGPGEGSKGGPGNVNLAHWIDVRPGVQTEIVQEIVDEAEPYVPCFALNLWDPAGHAVQAPPVCLTEVQGQRDGAGCSTVPGTNRRPGLPVIALAAGAALVVFRRRRRRR
jgi:hypothetical protein